MDQQFFDIDTAKSLTFDYSLPMKQVILTVRNGMPSVTHYLYSGL